MTRTTPYARIGRLAALAGLLATINSCETLTAPQCTSIGCMTSTTPAKRSVQSTVDATPISVWLGVKTSDDVGTNFDLRVELLKNGAVVATGQTNNLPGGSSGFNNAVLRQITAALDLAQEFASGEELGLRLSVRIAEGVSGHKSGTARLWYGDAGANSRAVLHLGAATETFYLKNGFVLGSAAGTSRQSIDVKVDRAVGSNAFKPFGTWTMISQLPPAQPAAVGSAGGTITSDDQTVALTIPSGALGTSTPITIGEAPAARPGAGEWAKSVELGPDGTTFAQPVQLKLKYDASKLPEGVLPEALKMSTWVDDHWEQVPGSVLNVADATVSAPITHFSGYTLSIWPNAMDPGGAPTPLFVGQQTTLSSNTWYWYTVPGQYCYNVYTYHRSFFGGYTTVQTVCYTYTTTYHYPITNTWVRWFSSAPGVASVGAPGYSVTDANGRSTSPPITANSAGSATITGNIVGVTYPVTLTVLPKLAISVFATGTNPLRRFGFGQGTGMNVTIPTPLAAPLTVGLTHSNPAVGNSNPFLVIAAGTTTQGVGIGAGSVAGRDTLIASAPGYSPDTLVIEAAIGGISVDGWPASLAMGDSVPVRLHPLNPDGIIDNTWGTTFTLAPNERVEFRRNGAVITSITVPDGTSSTPVFYVKAIRFGPGSAQVTHPLYTSASVSTTIAPPNLVGAQSVCGHTITGIGYDGTSYYVGEGHDGLLQCLSRYTASTGVLAEVKEVLLDHRGLHWNPALGKLTSRTWGGPIFSIDFASATVTHLASNPTQARPGDEQSQPAVDPDGVSYWILTNGQAERRLLSNHTLLKTFPVTTTSTVATQNVIAASTDWVFVLDGAAVNAYSKTSTNQVGRQPLPHAHPCNSYGFGVSLNADRILYTSDCRHVEVVPVTVTFQEPAQLAISVFATGTNPFRRFGFNQGTGMNVTIPSPLAAPLTVSLTHSTPAVAGSNPSLVIAAGATTQGVTIGTTSVAGRDTLIASAPGYSPDTLVIEAATGGISFDGWPASLAMGDSVPMRLHPLNPDGIIDNAWGTTFTLVPNERVEFRRNGAVITSITVPDGTSSTPVFYLRAIRFGPGSAQATHALYNPASVSTTIAPPNLVGAQSVCGHTITGVGYDGTSYYVGEGHDGLLQCLSRFSASTGALLEAKEIFLDHRGLHWVPALGKLTSRTWGGPIFSIDFASATATHLASNPTQARPGDEQSQPAVDPDGVSYWILNNGQAERHLLSNHNLLKTFPVTTTSTVATNNVIAVSTDWVFVLDGAAVNAYSKTSSNQVGRQPLPHAHPCNSYGFGVSLNADRILYTSDCRHMEVVPVTVTFEEPAQLAISVFATGTNPLRRFGFGQGTGMNVTIPSPIAAPLTVSLTHSNPAVGNSNPFLVIAAGATTQGVGIGAGSVAGRDTLIASAPGYSPDTLVIEAAIGGISVDGWPASLAMGDSVPVRLHPLNPDGIIDNTWGTTFTLVPNERVEFRRNGAVITNITVPDGSSSTPVFYVRAIRFGPGTAQVTHPLYTSANVSTTIAPPNLVGAQSVCGHTITGIGYDGSSYYVGEGHDGLLQCLSRYSATTGALLEAKEIFLDHRGLHWVPALGKLTSRTWGGPIFSIDFATVTVTHLASNPTQARPGDEQSQPAVDPDGVSYWILTNGQAERRLLSNHNLLKTFPVTTTSTVATNNVIAVSTDWVFVLDGAAVNAYSKVSDALVGRQPLPHAHPCNSYGFGVSLTADRILYTSDCRHVEVVPVTVTFHEPWTTGASMTPRAGGGGFVNGILYVAGGIVNDAVSNLLEAYDPETNSWTTKTPMPTPRADGAGAVLNGKVYYVGGNDGNNERSAAVEVYDPATDTWSSAAPLPRARVYVTATAVGGKLYVFGGATGDAVPFHASAVTDVDIYDPATNTWSSGAPMLSPRYTMTAGVLNGVIYLVGGYGPFTGYYDALGTVEAYDPATNTWSTKPSVPQRRGQSPGVVGLDGRLYAMGGFCFGCGENLQTVESFDPITNSWATHAPMSRSRWGTLAAVLSGAIYAVGGVAEGSGGVGVLDIFRP